MNVKNKIKELQQTLGIPNPDGLWGGSSQEILENSEYRLDLSPEFKQRLGNAVLQSRYNVAKNLRLESIDAILDAINTMDFGINLSGTKDYAAKNPLYAAYIFATAYHETAYSLYPLTEGGKGSTRKYGKVFKNSKGIFYGIANSDGVAYDYKTFPFLYYGRGLVQLTWFDNYAALSKVVGVDLTRNPEEANNPKYASKILVDGMINGRFTSRKLSSYIKYGLDENEFINARRIINGVDKKVEIAKHAYLFLENLILVKKENINVNPEEHIDTCKNCTCPCHKTS